MLTNMIFKIIPILIQIETGNLKDPNEAIGSFGEVGMLQVRQSVIDDVNRVYHFSKDEKYTLRDMHTPWLSSEVCFYYLSYWGDKKRLGHDATFEDLARIWNGGPRGWKKKSTRKYWNRVETALLQRYCRNEQYAMN
jgi:hypothetical protein